MKHFAWLAGGALSALLAIANAGPAQATTWSFKLLYAFCALEGCPDGEYPYGGVALDSSGNLYGTTESGGAHYEGALFELTRDGKPLVLHAFGASEYDGATPAAGVVLDKSENIFGTTAYGGAYGVGTVFEQPKHGAFRILTNLQLVEYPEAGVIVDNAGNLFGTTTEGGANGDGAVFEVTPKGVEETLYSFCAKSGCTDGETPQASLIRDKSGDLYGTAYAGGEGGEGVVFTVTPQGNEKVLCDFLAAVNCQAGAKPAAGLITDKAGNLYGTTSAGGTQNLGTVFVISSKDKEKLLYSFCSQTSCTDGEEPAAGLVMDKSGNLYGTTAAGGARESGTVFELSPNGKETVLYNFCEAAGCDDGEQPVAGLAMDKSGNLYGTTRSAGSGGGGTVFELVRGR
jgi:uncharacterized repeat protein (TIGR03803 family)